MTAFDVAFFDRSDQQARLDINGPDRAKFLQNLTTNEVKRLHVGEGREAFVTSPQGKVLGYGEVLAFDDRHVFRTDAGGLSHVLPHFAKYGLFDDVAWTDVGDQTFAFHLAGAGADGLLAGQGAVLPAEGELRHVATTIAGRDVRLVRESPTGRPGLTVLGAREDGPAVASALRPGVVEPGPEVYEFARIAAGTPAFGRDVTPENLPQEVGRDDRAISFVKGCYLGQETVARIDALGHVNKILRGLLIESGGLPAAATVLHAPEGKAAGTITSAARRGEVVIALAYVRVAFAKAGTVLAWEEGSARVMDLPMKVEGMP